jgi:acetolactate synthase small subunit
VERELLLATLPLDYKHRPAMLDTITLAGASIVDVGPTSVTVMLAGTPAACDELERALEVFTQVELHRTGRVALPRLG